MIQKFSNTYLFQQHPQKLVINWVAQLHYFYFIRAAGGHANDGDEFKAGIKYLDRADLVTKLGQLGIRPGQITQQDPQPEPGKAYQGSEFSQFKTPVKHFPDMEQPGHVVIGGVKLFLWITPETIQFSIAGQADGNLYEVSQTDFEACLKLEKVFDQLSWQPLKDERISNSIQCVSSTVYPELFLSNEA